MRIGFIGLGTMGLPMAQCLVKNGVEVLGWDIDPRAMRAFGTCGKSLQTLAAECGVFITMLPEETHVANVQRQLLDAGIAESSLFIDCSTIDVESTKCLADNLASMGHGFVDAPVSGGSEAAVKGALSFVVGGSPASIERTKPLLMAMGERHTEFGVAGSGQAAKACHNMICGITALGVCEGFALADALGLDLKQFFQLCSNAAAQSWVLQNRCPVPGPAPDAPSSNAYAPGFAARLMAKDLKLAQRAANNCGQSTDFGAEAARRFTEFAVGENTKLDFSAIYSSIRN
ncbi:MAG TPA: 3-hydroxyisobutyrate dehydrogenase [Alphaproteobacteria bacterium]|nr:3-hydroxyisobutyrate dehydrogenase [Alphaproteobacteria bacterium]